jgi:hypothetical protein
LKARDTSAIGGATIGIGWTIAPALAFALLLLLLLLLPGAASAAAPTTTVEPPTGVTYTGAHLNGKVNPEGGPSTTCWHFEYGPKANVEEHEEGWIHTNIECLSEEESAKAEALAVATDLSNLPGGAVYLVRLAASNDDGEFVSSQEEFKTKDVTPPSVTINPVSGVTGSTATFSGSVNPNAPEGEPTSAEVEAGYHTVWHFECKPSCDGGSGELAADDTAHAVEHEGHQTVWPGTTRVKLVAENAGGKTVAETSFETPTVAPVVSYLQSAPANLVTDTEARLVGLVDPRNSGSLTECKFEYGLTASYGSVVPCSQESDTDEEDGTNEILISGNVANLKPNATYHFRLVAANSAGSDAGADNHFTTFASAPAETTCPNEAVRVEQKASILADCRAWEMVTPVDKNGGEIRFEEWNIKAAGDGNAVGFISKGSFGETKGSGIIGITQYMAWREPNSWGETQGITPTPPLSHEPVFVLADAVVGMSEDLSHGIVSSRDLPGVSDDIPDGSNLYWLNTRTGELQTISKSFADTPGLLDFYIGETGQFDFVRGVGFSADQHVLAFSQTTRLLPDAPAGVRSVYEWEEGTLRLASILPDGSVATEGAKAPRVQEKGAGSVSRDGSLVTFLAPKEGQDQLYVRRNHSDTVWVSESEGSAPVAAPEAVQLQYITQDSRHILFRTSSPLLDADENTLSDLYMYTDGPNPTAEQNLTLISSGQEKGSLNPIDGFQSMRTAVLGTSDDGSYVYYMALGENGGPQAVKLWNGGVRKDLVELDRPIDYDQGANGYPGATKVSADGTKLALITESGTLANRGLSGLDRSNPGLPQAYVYDDEEEAFSCASCRVAAPGSDEDPVTSHEVIEREPYSSIPELQGTTISWIGAPRYFSRDGKHLFFSTAEALVPEDKNENWDAYEYNVETGRQSLISSGRGDTVSAFADASADGKTAVFFSKEQLVGRDVDALRDVYVARVNGGFVEPPPPPTPCVGDGCRGPIPVAPADPSPTTPRFTGPGNPKPKHRKHKRHHGKKKNHHGKKHHGTKKKQRHDRGGAK